MVSQQTSNPNGSLEKWNDCKRLCVWVGTLLLISGTLIGLQKLLALHGLPTAGSSTLLIISSLAILMVMMANDSRALPTFGGCMSAFENWN